MGWENLGRSQGLAATIAAKLTSAVWQRCHTHYSENPMSVTLNVMWPGWKRCCTCIHDQPDRKAMNEQPERLPDYVDGKLHDALDHLDAARSGIFAFTGFAQVLWQQL